MTRHIKNLFIVYHTSTVLLFSKLNKIFFLDTLIQNIFFEIMKLTNFRGELIDISAKKEALVDSMLYLTTVHQCLCFTQNIGSGTSKIIYFCRK